MYQLEGSLCLGRTIGAQWQTPDLTNVFMYSVLSEFRKIFLVVSHPAAEGPLYVDLDSIRTAVSSYPFTVTQWLEDMAGQSLPTVPVLPNGDLRYAKYGNAMQANYISSFARAGFHQVSGAVNTVLPDVRLTRPSISTPMRSIDSHCLVTVSGFIHPTVSNDQETFILHAGDTARRSKEPHIGIWSFLDVGALTKIPVTPDMIQAFEEDGTMWEKMRLSVDHDLTGKSVFLVMGGIPMFLEAEAFYPVGARSFALDLRRLSYEEKVIFSRDQIDLSSLMLDYIDDAPNHIDQAQLRSDDVITRYFQLPQTFVVVVDTPQLFVSRIPVLRAAFPGQFIHTEDPVYPLTGPFGKLMEYWKRREDERWSLATRDSFARKYVFKDAVPNQAVHISEALDPTYPFDHVYGRLLEVTGVSTTF